MRENFNDPWIEVTCKNCGKSLKVREVMVGSVGFGNKSREEIMCPECNEVIYSKFTSGVLETSDID